MHCFFFIFSVLLVTKNTQNVQTIFKKLIQNGTQESWHPTCSYIRAEWIQTQRTPEIRRSHGRQPKATAAANHQGGKAYGFGIVISLLVLIAVILIGFFRKINVGLLAVLAVTIFGSLIGESDSSIISGFSSSTFVTLLGVSFLCAVGITNGSLELLSKKFLQLSGGHAIVAPILIYIIGYGIAAIGPGCVPALGIVSALSLPLGKSTGYDSVMLAVIGEIGSFA